MNNYKSALLNRLHTTISEKNRIENGNIRFLSYDIVVDPEIVKLENKNGAICSVYFYVKAPLFEDIFFEHSYGIASNEYKAIEMASDNFVYCPLNGIIDFLNGVYHHEIETYILSDKKLFTVCESPMICVGNRNDIGFDEKNNYSSFLWTAISEELPFILGNKRVHFIRIFCQRTSEEKIIIECSINNINDKTLENRVAKSVEEGETDFFSVKQFFFILQDNSTYKKYPYSREEIEYFVMEAVLEFENAKSDYDKYVGNLEKIIFDGNVIEEIINFLPDICLRNSFKNISFDEKIDVYVGKYLYKAFRNQFTSYKFMEDSLMDGFSNNVFKKETFYDLARVSESYKLAANNEDNIIAKFRFGENYKLI